ncbi:EscU/YscU/HrcU family type III secretion system export apparatus switch protein [Tautonia sociabilis]|uniref:Flagellar biosynthesis protein FlhB n=1 Tax=Tautonia sociabilis TaxID=2080755 RepID=A0A432MDN0_9BACT|nr:EscU/YscU/HrcU family type III secretion system export apparatus switch protein [Tautonia sociabilis]RUL82944.1 hypothetical protein TsocGM_23095 [Tautonia sociabilis]
MSDDRTLEPSPRRIREARERGQVARSAELTAAVGLLAAVAVMGAVGQGLVEGLIEAMRASLPGEEVAGADPGAFVERIREAIGAVAMPMAAVLAVPALASVAAHQVQVGGLFVPALALPDPGRLGPGAAGGASGGRLGRASGAMLRLAALVALAWWAIRAVDREVSAAADGPPAELLRASASTMHAAMLRLGLAMLAIGLVDYGMQVRRLNARLRMSPEERREEQRALDGDPGLRARRRAARGRVLEARGVDGASAADRI